MRNLMTAALVLSLTAGCSGSHRDRSDEAALRQDLEAARAELTRHHGVVINAVSLDVVLDDVEYHNAQMADLMDGMRNAMQNMSHCSGSGMSQMQDMMVRVDTDMLSHEEAISITNTLDSARALCVDHLESMTVMFDGMGQALNQMACMNGG